MKMSVLAVFCGAVISFSGCAMNEYTVLKDPVLISKYVGKKVCVKGTVSRTPWQHMIGIQEGYPFSEYFDIGDYQIVIYSREPVRCKGEVLVYGSVVLIEGQTKDPARKEAATEYHLRVDRWECQ
jgi:hypothetical protein